MGGSESKATVLECMIKNLKKGFGGDSGVKMKPHRLHILCEVEWPPMGVGWPPENTMNLRIVEAVYSEESRDTWINIHILTHGSGELKTLLLGQGSVSRREREKH